MVDVGTRDTGRSVPTVKWGIVSTAWIAGLVAPCIAEVEGSTLSAVASRDQDRAGRFAAEFGVARIHETYESLIDDGDIDIVYVPLPNSLHHEWVRRALHAGKHVLCEKPLTLDSTQAAELFALAESKGLVLMEAFMYRHHPQIQAAIDAIDAGRIGTVQGVYSSFFTRAGDVATNIRYNRALRGGALWDVGSYCVSLSSLICGGEPLEVAGSAQTESADVDTSFFGQIAFPGGRVAQIACGIGAELRTELIVVGSEGTLTMGNPWLPDIAADVWGSEPPWSGFAIHRGTVVEKVPVPGRNPYYLQASNMVGAVAGLVDPVVGRDETVATLRAVEALRSSAGLGRPSGPGKE